MPTEKVENTQVSAEAKSVINVQIGEGDNKQLLALNQAQRDQLKTSGVLPELSITGGTELDYVRNNFDKLDGSKDGHITKKEIEDYLAKNKDLSTAEKETLKKIAANVDKLEKHNIDAELDRYSDYPTYGPEGGITRADVEIANQRMKLEDYANKNFEKLDQNGDGHVNADEIDAYKKANEGKLSKDEVRNLDGLAKEMNRLQNAHNDEWGFENDGFTRHDLLESKLQSGTANLKLAQKNFEYGKGENGCEVPPENCDPKTAKEGSKEYTVKPGDSLWKICKEELKQRNGGQEASNKDILEMVKRTAELNKMPVDGLIKEGDKLKLPGKTDPNCEVQPAKPPVKQEVPAREKPVIRPPSRQEDPNCEVPPLKPPVREQDPDCEVPGEKRQEPAEPSEGGNESRKRNAHKSAAEVMRDRFSEMDKDGNNHVSRKEIERYVAQNQDNLSADEIRALDTLSKNVGKIQELANDEKGDENSGISRQDLNKLDELSQKSEQYLRDGSFNAFDSNRNNYLTKEEITRALTTARLTREERQTLEFLKDNLKYLQKGNNDERGFENNGISLADMRFYAGLV